MSAQVKHACAQAQRQTYWLMADRDDISSMLRFLKQDVVLVQRNPRKFK